MRAANPFCAAGVKFGCGDGGRVAGPFAPARSRLFMNSSNEVVPPVCPARAVALADVGLTATPPVHPPGVSLRYTVRPLAIRFRYVNESPSPRNSPFGRVARQPT